MTLDKILDLPMGMNDAGADTISEYLCRLLLTLWERKEGFNAKRPFGNGGWEYDLYFALVRAGVVEGLIDEFGDCECYETKKADTVIRELIIEMSS